MKQGLVNFFQKLLVLFLGSKTRIQVTSLLHHFDTCFARFKVQSKNTSFLDMLSLVLSIVKVNKLNYNVQKRRKTCLTLLSKKAKQIRSILARKILVKNS